MSIRSLARTASRSVPSEPPGLEHLPCGEREPKPEPVSQVIADVDPKKHPRHREEYVKRGFGLYLKKKKPKEEPPPPSKGRRGAKSPEPSKPVSPKPKKPEKLDFTKTIDVEEFMKNLASNVVTTSTKRDVLENFASLAGGDED